MQVKVRPYVRRHIVHAPRLPSTAGSLGAIIDDVIAGRRAGYTWTIRWKFDIDDSVSMEKVYNQLGDRTMYVVATTHRTLEEWEGPEQFSVRIGGNEGVGLWRDPHTGEIYIDNVILFFGPKVSEQWALNYAASHGQQSILKVDGSTRSFDFLGVPKWTTT